MKKQSLNKLRLKAWTLQSKYICTRDHWICFTCGGVGNQTGHLVHHGSRGKYGKNLVDFDERNLACQCVRCNHYLHGNGGIFGIKVYKKYGDIWDELVALRSKVFKPTVTWYCDKIEELEIKIRFLETKL